MRTYATKPVHRWTALVIPVILSICAGGGTLNAQGTAFTYQGSLKSGATAANGSYDFQFELYYNSLGGGEPRNTVWTNAVPVTNGQFTVAIDFGAGTWTGSNCWLEIGVRTNNGSNYTVMTPLQAITPTPYAFFANTTSNLTGLLPAAQLSGAVPSSSISGSYGNAVTINNPSNEFSGSFAGNGGNLTALNASQLTSGVAAVSVGGTGTTSARSVGANIGMYQASPTIGNDAFADISNAVPAFIGQVAMSWYGNRFPFFWTAISTSGSGQANWTGSAYFPGRLLAGDPTHMNPSTDIGENAFIANGTGAFTDPTNLFQPADNVMSLKNQHPAHYSAMRWLSSDYDNLGERGAVGYGGSRSSYRNLNYIEDYGGQSGFYFGYSGYVAGGMEKTTQNFVWYNHNNPGTNVQSSNAVFRVDNSGNVSAAGNATLTGTLRTTTGGTEIEGALDLTSGGNVGGGIKTYGSPAPVDFFDASGNDIGYLTGAGLVLVQGGIDTALVTESSDYTVAAGDSTILVSGVNLTITLPPANSGATSGIGRIYTIKQIAASGQTEITNATGSQTIDGSLTYTLPAQYKYVTVQSDGHNWFITANN